MKSTTVLPVLLAAMLAGCGQTGPLYMPTPPAKPAPASSQVPPQPVPSNNSSTPAPTK